MPAMQNIVSPPGYQYKAIAAGQTGAVVATTTGAKGDYLDKLVISVVTVASAGVTLIDGSTSIVLLTGAATLVPGVYTVPLGIYSVNGAWSITTGAGATVVAIGNFAP